jgi:hypothetical protein
MANRSDYGLGSIWLVSFDPARGTEINQKFGLFRNRTFNAIANYFIEVSQS